MILSHKYKFIFIKTAKTAGTSLEVFYAAHCGPDDVLTPIWPVVEEHRPANYRGWSNPVLDLAAGRGRSAKGIVKNFIRRNRYYNHMPAWLVKRRVGRSVWDEYHTFCVERNPFEKALSHYHMMRKYTGKDLSVDEYLAMNSFPRNHRLYTDVHDRIMVDQVIRYENLDQELDALFAKLGVPFPGSLQARAKGNFRSDRKPYTEVFNAQQRQALESIFATELALHGYTFQ